MCAPGGILNESSNSYSSGESSTSSDLLSTSTDSDHHTAYTLATIPSDLSHDKLGKPTQPVLEFPTRTFGSTKRSFHSTWYTTYTWLEHSQQKDAAFCFYCHLFKPPGPTVDPAFVLSGFRDWKHACGKKGAFASHASSRFHKACMLNSEQFKLNVQRGCTVGERLDNESKKEIKRNRHYVKSLAEIILTCAQQGLALRGHGDSMDDPSINPGNFKVLVSLLSKHDDVVRKRLTEGPRNATFLGHALQNELLAVMAGKVMEKIQAEVCEAHYYTIMADETRDISKKEQLSVLVRYVHNGLIHERFIGYIHATELDASALTEYILWVISELHLGMESCVSQCYDGASVTSGACSGVSARITELNPKAVYVHCCAHRLNLAL